MAENHLVEKIFVQSAKFGPLGKKPPILRQFRNKIEIASPTIYSPETLQLYRNSVVNLPQSITKLQLSALPTFLTHDAADYST